MAPKPSTKSPVKAMAAAAAASSSYEGQLDLQLVPASAPAAASAVSAGDLGALVSFPLPATRREVACGMGCGVTGPPEAMYQANSNAAFYCHPCRNAKRAIEAAARAGGQKEALDRLKVEDPEAFRDKIRACRMAMSDSEPGCFTSIGRKCAVAKAVKGLTQSVGLREEASLLWLTARQWVSWHGQWEGASREQAEATWAQRLADPTVEKRGQGANVRMSVEDIPRTVIHRGRELATGVERETSVNTAGQADAAMGDMANLDGLDAAEMASVFGGGQAARQLALSLPASSAMAAAPRTSVIPLDTFEVPAKRSLAAQLSDPTEQGASAAGAGSAKRPRRGAAAAVTGDLLAMVEKGTALFGQLLAEYGHRRSNLGTSLLAKYRAIKKEVPADIQGRIDGYLALATQIREAKAGIKNWTMSTAKESMMAMAPVAQELERLSKCLKEDMATFETARDEVRSERRAAIALEAKTRSRDMSPFAGQLPKNLCRFLYDRGVLAKFKAVPLPADKGDNWPSVRPGEATFDLSAPAFFAPDVNRAGGAGAKVQSLATLLDSAKLAGALQEAMALLATNPAFTTTRLSKADQALDKLAWVPEDMKAKGLPEALRGVGGAWLFVSDGGQFRAGGPDDWPTQCCGQFVIGTAGANLLLAWPMSSVLERGCKFADHFDFLFSLPQKEFTKWANAHLRWTVLPPGAAAWIPYGFFGSLLANLSGRTQAVVQPFLAAKMANESSTFMSLVPAIERTVEGAMAANDYTWSRLGRSYLEFLASCREGDAQEDDEADESGEEVEAERQPIADGDEDTPPPPA
jgi:hypothetical protein